MSLITFIRQSGFFVLMAVLSSAGAQAQTTRILVGNGNVTSHSAPQGSLKFQRQFYLIDSAEMSRSDVKAGMAINQIGFTIGTAQNKSTKGLFRVYLQNTNDAQSRLDTGWNRVSVTGTSLQLTGLKQGQFEWRVKSACSDFTPGSPFEITSDTCLSPTHPATDNLSATGVRLKWIRPVSYKGSFKVEYSRTDTVNWMSVNTAATYYDLTGLLPNKTYQWKVTSLCSEKPTVSVATFTTPTVASCSALTNLIVGTREETTASFTWNKASDAEQYQVRYRRVGTGYWNETISLSPDLTLGGLYPGTTYEWQVRKVCGPDTYGSWTAGTLFATTGTLACYAPENVYVDSVTASAVKLSWDPSVGAGSYIVEYRQRNVISWIGATSGMTTVHSDSLFIPHTTGPYSVRFANGNAFQYTGRGVYIAFEYIDTTGGLSSTNFSLVHYQKPVLKDGEGNDSINYVMSLGAVGNDSLETLLTGTYFRPETWFGTNAVADSAAVVAVYAMGKLAVPYAAPSAVSALVRNYTTQDKTYPATLTVKNSYNGIRHSETVMVTVKADSVSQVLFTPWAPKQEGEDSILVTIPGQPSENALRNNTAFYIQTATQSLLAYADETAAVSGTGIDTSAGLVLTRYPMRGCGAINAIQVYLHSSAAGHPVAAVLLNASGKVLSQTPAFTPDSSTSGRYHTFYLTTPVAVAAGDSFYVGLSQTFFGNGYTPVGVQWEAGYPRKGAYFRARSDGSGIQDVAAPGRLMIRAEVVPSTVSPVVTGNFVLCAGSTNTLSAASMHRRFAKEVVSASSEAGTTQYAAANVLGTPDAYPQYGLNTNAWIGAGSRQREHVSLRFAEADYINAIELYEVYNSGAVDTVSVKNPSTGEFEIVYTATAALLTDSVARINRIQFPLTAYKVDEIRIALNAEIGGGYSALDAVAIGRINSSTPFASYQWSVETGTGKETKGNGSSLSVTTPGNYTLAVTNSNGCKSSVVVKVTSPQQNPPVIQPAGPLAICSGDSILLSSSKKGNNTWSTGEQADAIWVKTSGSYTVQHNDGSGCGSVSSVPVLVTVNSLPLVSIDGILGICDGSFTTLTAQSGSATSYQWSNGEAGNSTVVSAPGDVEVTVTDNLGCRSSASVTTFLVVNPQPKISGQTNFCPGGSTSLSVASGFASYTWSGVRTGVPTQLVSRTGISSVTVADEYGCKGTDSVTVGQFPAPTPVISGSLSLCGGSTILNASSGYTQYTWNTGLASQSITVTQQGTYTVNIVDNNGCTASASATTVEASLPPTPGPIRGQNTGNCSLPGTDFSIDAVKEASHYVWFVPEGVTIANGQGSTAIQVSFGPDFKQGVISVAASNACGQSGSLNPSVFMIQMKPAKPTAISGALSGVCASSKTYSVPPQTGATAYTWTVPMGATITSGLGTPVISVTFSSQFTGGTICVSADNNCGKSDPVCLPVTALPNAPALINGPSTVCQKAKGIVYTTPSIDGATNYTWTVPAQATIVSGQGTTSIRVDFGTSSGNVSVQATNGCGSSPVLTKAVPVVKCSASGVEGVSSSVANLTGTQQVVRDVLAPAGNSSHTTTMQIDWTLGEPCVEMASSKERKYTQGFHQPMLIVSKLMPAADLHLQVSAAPNPVSNRLRVTINTDKESFFQLRLSDGVGKVLFSKKVLSTDRAIDVDMANLPQAIYYLEISNLQGNTLQTFKIVKVN